MAHEATPPAIGHQLGAPGPFMVCRECQEPLHLFSLVSLTDKNDTQKITYVHCQEHIDANGNVLSLAGKYDHEAVPVEGNPIDAATTCDFCQAPSPRWVFVPRRSIRLPDPFDSSRVLDFSSPWTCCDGCLPAVRHKRLGAMIDRVMASQYSSVLPEYRRDARARVRELHKAYLKSDPAGPYEQKIQPPHRPYGKRGSRRGMS